MSTTTIPQSEIDAALVVLAESPSERQEVAPEIAELGLNAIRTATSDIAWNGAPLWIQPNYALYRDHIAQFIYGGKNKVPIVLAGSTFCDVAYTGEKLPIPLPILVIGWGKTRVAEEVAEQFRNSGFKDSMIRSVPVLVKANPTIEDARQAINAKASLTSPCSAEHMNVFAFRQLNTILNLASCFLKIHQYPAFLDEDAVSDFCMADWQQVDPDADKHTTHMDVDDENVRDKKTSGWKGLKMPVKLITPFDDMPLSYDLKHVPEGHGVFFRYFSELAKFDFSTIPSVINRYFLGCLADDEEDAQERFANIKQGYGIIAKTETGKILSHLFFCIDLSLRLQTTLRVVIHNGIYCGVVMLGTGYTLRMLGRDIVPQRPEVLKASYLKASPHANALDQIFQKLDFGSDEQKQRYLSTTNSMWDLKRIIQGVSVIGGSTGVEAVKKLAKKLYFPGEVAVPASANGIQSVLRCISDGTKDISTLGYLHHSYLFSEDRVELAFAAFGGVAPSFRVPTGRHMKINEAFRVTSKDRSGNVTTRDVNKISAHLVPLEVAIKEFRDFMRDKTVFNVFGNQVVHTSDSAIFKTYKDEGFIAVLGALREVAGVTTVDTQSGGKKRKADDDAEGGRKKKKYVEEF